ncbi:hypothetical protein WNY63_10465 [Pseudoalteromonas neustonica]|uniref:Phage shock protein B n=2 Tax=Pseudoalteromonas TaxID=53246 RepID=A0ABU9U292_9GAMM|nr:MULTISPECIES: hypothetical protein [Pseudoalteromonas]
MMLELFLVTMVFSSPLILLVIIKHYFAYKTTVQKELVLLQQANRAEAVLTMQNKLAVLIERIIVLEKIVTNSNVDLSREIEQL